MNRFAGHLDGADALLDAAGRCAAVAAGFIATRMLDRRPHAALRAQVDVFAACLAEARDAAGADEAEARVMLRDGVNLVHELRRALISLPRSHRELWKQSGAILAEFKPSYCRHHGFEMFDRVGLRSCGVRVLGTVSHLDPFDNDRGRVLMDQGGYEIEVEIASLHHVPAHAERTGRTA